MVPIVCIKLYLPTHSIKPADEVVLAKCTLEFRRLRVRNWLATARTPVAFVPWTELAEVSRFCGQLGQSTMAHFNISTSSTLKNTQPKVELAGFWLLQFTVVDSEEALLDQIQCPAKCQIQHQQYTYILTLQCVQSDPHPVSGNPLLDHETPPRESHVILHEFITSYWIIFCTL